MLYERLKEREKHIRELTNLGLVNPVWLRNLEIFELFKAETKKGTRKYDAYIKVSEQIKPNVSWQSVRKIVSDLGK
jgi:hypothetical protein